MENILNIFSKENKVTVFLLTLLYVAISERISFLSLLCH